VLRAQAGLGCRSWATRCCAIGRASAWLRAAGWAGSWAGGNAGMGYKGKGRGLGLFIFFLLIYFLFSLSFVLFENMF
jgi:hypothetical protein